MKMPYAEPDPAGSERARAAKKFRDLATEVSRLRPQAMTRTNGEEADHHNAKYPANFTKGLLHDSFGLVDSEDDYRRLVEAINSPDPVLFEKGVETAATRNVTYNCKRKDGKALEWRGWESPRAGHAYELEGADPGSVGMAPAPRVGSSELAAEMAEVYGLALLRDVPFTTTCTGGNSRLCGSPKGSGTSVLSAAEVVKLLKAMKFYSGQKPVSSTPMTVDETGLNRFERNRRFARTQSINGALSPATAFRGSTKGALRGPYISQFMLIGATSLKGPDTGATNFPGEDANFGLRQGFIPYGSLIIDQRTLTHENCLDYMTDWCSWLDVQNGANLKNTDLFEDRRRFITTPRDLATYVHFDALYEAYLNACLILLAMGAPASKGFPEPSLSGRRDAFATFGGPHILSLVTEVATRCLKAVRRQKFNYHRRARPETIAGRLALVCMGRGAELGCAESAFCDTLEEIPLELRNAVIEHNARQNEETMAAMRGTDCGDGNCLPPKTSAKELAKSNLLLPMAFPEGSPMHPAYGAGHATVAGGCVTMLKAFFEMFEDCNGGEERPLRDGTKRIAYVPDVTGSALMDDTSFKGTLTIQGELDKLAANISIGRNMAGVHYYSDYYDSLRMGERIAVSILLEQAPSYGETVQTTFNSFDGDFVTITGEAGSCPSLSIVDRAGNPVAPHDWWLRHVCGQEVSEDL